MIKRVITDGTLQALELWLHDKDPEIPLKRCTTAASETAMEHLEWEPAKRLSVPAGQQSRYFDNSLLSVAKWTRSPSLTVEVIRRANRARALAPLLQQPLLHIQQPLLQPRSFGRTEIER